MELVGCVLTVQGISFAVIQVHAYSVETQAEADEAVGSYSRLVNGLPVVLMTVGVGRPRMFWGRSDLAQYMARLPEESIPWRTIRVPRAGAGEPLRRAS